MIVQRGYKQPTSFHTSGCARAEVGYFFNVMTEGYGVMPTYAPQIPVDGPLGDRGLHPRPPVQPERPPRRPAAGAPGGDQGQARPAGRAGRPGGSGRTRRTRRAWRRDRRTRAVARRGAGGSRPAMSTLDASRAGAFAAASAAPHAGDHSGDRAVTGPATTPRPPRSTASRSSACWSAAVRRSPRCSAGSWRRPPSSTTSSAPTWWPGSTGWGSRSAASPLLMLHHLTRGDWGVVARRILEAATRTLPVAPPARPAAVRLRPAPPLQLGPGRRHGRRRRSCSTRRGTSTLLFFWIRQVLYFAIWLLLAWLLNRLSLAQDRTGDPRLFRGMQKVAGARPARLRPGGHLRLGRLADVAPAALVLDHLRRLPDGQPGARGARLPDHRGALPRPARADVAASSCRATSTTTASCSWPSPCCGPTSRSPSS